MSTLTNTVTNILRQQGLAKLAFNLGGLMSVLYLLRKRAEDRVRFQANLLDGGDRAAVVDSEVGLVALTGADSRPAGRHRCAVASIRCGPAPAPRSRAASRRRACP